jgi:hypothetical protein
LRTLTIFPGRKNEQAICRNSRNPSNDSLRAIAQAKSAAHLTAFGANPISPTPPCQLADELENWTENEYKAQMKERLVSPITQRE